MKLFKNTFFALLFCCVGIYNGFSQSRNHQEQHRPQLHFTPQKGWMNDPNGLVFLDGEYHLFYQYYPDSTVWGPMHWGHAISTDLVHWKHLPIALYPDSLGYIFSGSAVIDKNNTTGFQKGKTPPMVAIFSYHNMAYEKAGRKDAQTQGIAYSLDKGRTWTKYSGNPVLKNKGDVNFRDPKVFWHEQTKHWVMPLAVGDHLEIFRSPNLKDWVLASTFGKEHGTHGGTWECPDLFPIKTSDDVEKWVLIQNMDRGGPNGGGSCTQYFVGEFNGEIFTNDNEPKKIMWFDYGPDNYAGVTWGNTPNNRKIFMGWISDWLYGQVVPTKIWRSSMSVPRELSLVKTDEGYRLFQQPVPEIRKIRNTGIMVQYKRVLNSLVLNEKSVQKEIILEFDLSKKSGEAFGFVLSNTKNERVVVGYNKAKQEFYIDRTQSGKISFSDKFARRNTAPLIAQQMMTIRALVDNTSVEVFVDGGKLAMTNLFFPNEDYTNLAVFSTNGATSLKKATVFGLKSIWQ